VRAVLLVRLRRNESWGSQELPLRTQCVSRTSKEGQRSKGKMLQGLVQMQNAGTNEGRKTFKEGSSWGQGLRRGLESIRRTLKEARTAKEKDRRPSMWLRHVFEKSTTYPLTKGRSN